jgi:ABC-2 type transport system permease protein
LPTGIGDPGVLLILVLSAMLGFGFWFTLFALVAATITDPNTSSRSSLLFLPFLPLGLTMTGMDQPDAVWMRALALIPGLSPVAMPVRVMRGDPWVGEIALSLLLLGAMVWVFRRAAGRVFAVSMLMTGKEPSWGEVWRWLRVD